MPAGVGRARRLFFWENSFSFVASTRTKKRKKDEPVWQASPIIVEGARTHNLRSVSCQVPPGALTVVTGISGSGKSSLAFDTLFAEGQRRYVESLSTYARQFIARMPRPDVDQIDNIPPAIALEQKNPVRNARSTVGTATEINDYLRLVWAKTGKITCPQTGEEVRRDTIASIASRLLSVWKGEGVYLVAPIRLEKKSMREPTLRELLRQGFTRILGPDGEVIDLDDPEFKASRVGEEIRVVVDRLILRQKDRSRLADGIETAYRLGKGRCIVRTRGGEERRYTEDLRCESCPGDCGLVFREPSIQLLNFSSPLGACPTCQGFGRVTGLDWGKIIPDPSLTLDEGAVAPWNGEAGRQCLEDLRDLSDELNVRLDVPWEKLNKRERRIVRDGQGDWYGIRGYFDWLADRRYKVQARVMIARYRGYSPCPDCEGYRLRDESLNIRVDGRHIGEICDLSVKELAEWFDQLKLSRDDAEIAERPLEEVRSRLKYLLDVGLGYLTLSRQTRTLSGGESQRINLATALGSALTDTLYVLDEPTVGLHPRDTHRLIAVLRRLTELGNSVVVVEHDFDVIRAADYLVDIGPEAGEKGGEVLYEGRSSGLLESGVKSKTAQYIREDPAARHPRTRPAKSALKKHGRREATGWITVNGASENNLRALTARIPLGVMCCVTGVSGSGKSSLIKTCLYENYRREVRGESAAEPGEILSLDGLEQIDDVIMIDQSPIGRSSRSNAATYLKAYDQIRTLLADTPHAKALGLRPRDFSFNVTGGRCEACEGTGRQTIDMHFLADVQVVCDVCEGRRFQDRVLEIEWNGYNISRILEMTVNEALDVFSKYRKIRAGLEPLARVGLGYLRLGQSTATLSGGEAQRLKLAAHLAETSRRGNALLLFDEPTTGLHAADLDVLIGVFQDLLLEGYSLVVIEHNLQLIRQADYVIDMGPDGGDEGGEIVAEGTPEEIAASKKSKTGRFLAEIVQTGKRKSR